MVYDEEFFDKDFFTGKRGIDRTKPWSFWEMLAKKIIEIFPDKSIVEIGCGVGQLVKALSDFGVDVKGYDISDWAIKHATCNRVFKSDVRDLQENMADIIVCWNILAYLEEKDIDRAIDCLKKSFRKYLLLRALPIEGWTEEQLPKVKEWGRKTFKSLSWWQNKYYEHGLIPDEWTRCKFWDVLKGDGNMYPTFFVFKKEG